MVKYGGGILLRKRGNESAKGSDSSLTGTVLKNQGLTDTVHRVSEEELGCTVEIVKSFGVFEHFCDTAELPEINSKHYVANGFIVTSQSKPEVDNDQRVDCV